MKAAWLILFIILGCRNESSLVEGNGRLTLKDVEMKLSNLNDIDWKVGTPKKNSVVTQSIVFSVELPYLDEASRETLYKRYGMDGWILRLTQKVGSQQIPMGEVYAPMAGIKNQRNKNVEIKQTKSVSIKIFYAAAYMSERFRTFNCPAFGHNRKVSDMEIFGDFSLLNLPIKSPEKFNSTPMIAELNPAAFNAGHSLVGDYFVEVALFSLKNKTLGTSFTPLKEIIRIGTEEKISVNGCAGVHQELK